MRISISPIPTFSTAGAFMGVIPGIASIENPLTDEEYQRIKEEWKKSHTGWAVFIACSYCGRKHSQSQGVCDGCGAPL